MRATGIVRRVDDLGRIVIPRDLRKQLKIEEGQPMEYYVDQNNNLVLHKYDPSETDMEDK